MPRIRSSAFETATARLKLAPKWIAYTGPTLAKGIKLLYRRNKNGAGSWIVRVANNLTPSPTEAKPKTPYWQKAFALADDYDKADCVDVLNYGQAQDRAKELVRGGGGAGKPKTVDQALSDYERDLAARGASPTNSRWVRYHMTPSLAAKPVELLTAADLKDWRNTVAAKKQRNGKPLSPATINRIRVGLRAALELASENDSRIKNRDAFRKGLKGLPHANRARRMVLPDADVLRIVAEAYRVSQPFGLLIEVLAQTGARMSQIVRVNCGDLRPGKLMVPPSYKGRGVKKQERVAVPITPALTAALEALRGGRADDDPLLLTKAGERWPAKTDWKTRDPFRTAVMCAGLDPEKITPYALRHSSICRRLLNGVAMMMVAAWHDTSPKEIVAHYAHYIDDVAEHMASRGLLQSPADNVVNLPKVAA
jgi:integrase